jgi:DNA-binding transcriptional LysR family regulator
MLPGLLADFKEKYPSIDINLVIGDTKGIINKIVDNEVELGIIGTKEKNAKLVFHKFTTERLVLIAPADCKWLTAESVTLNDLKGVPFILRETGSGTRATIRKKLREAGISEGEFTRVMTLGSTAAVKRAVERGAGVSFISEKAIEKELRLGTLKTISVKDLALDRDFFIVYRQHKSHSPATKALLQFLEERGDQRQAK